MKFKRLNVEIEIEKYKKLKKKLVDLDASITSFIRDKINELIGEEKDEEKDG